MAKVQQLIVQHTNLSMQKILIHHEKSCPATDTSWLLRPNLCLTVFAGVNRLRQVVFAVPRHALAGRPSQQTARLPALIAVTEHSIGVETSRVSECCCPEGDGWHEPGLSWQLRETTQSKKRLSWRHCPWLPWPPPPSCGQVFIFALQLLITDNKEI